MAMDPSLFAWYLLLQQWNNEEKPRIKFKFWKWLYRRFLHTVRARINIFLRPVWTLKLQKRIKNLNRPHWNFLNIFLLSQETFASRGFFSSRSICFLILGLLHPGPFYIPREKVTFASRGLLHPIRFASRHFCIPGTFASRGLLHPGLFASWPFCIPTSQKWFI